MQVRVCLHSQSMFDPDRNQLLRTPAGIKIHDSYRAMKHPDINLRPSGEASPDKGDGPVLVLQGPLGGFFRNLCLSLREDGVEVDTVAFNLADVFFLRGTGPVIFRGNLDSWRAWLQDYIRTRRPRCILLFGDRRPIHKVACELAAAAGVRVFCFEEGYVRPDFVTLEEYGNNARSPFHWDRNAPLPEPRHVRHPPDSFGAMGWYATVYYILKGLGRPFFPAYLHHRNRNFIAEALLWNRSGLRKLLHQDRDRRTLAALEATDAPVFVVALQVHDDLQIIEHGRGWTPESLIESCIASFARSAPGDAILAIRAHPMDRGHRDYVSLINTLVARHGLGDRVVSMDTGSPARLLEIAAGCVTINSTVTISAFYHKCPVAILGSAFFRDSGLVTPVSTDAELDAFFAGPPDIDVEACRHFRASLIAQTQVNGSYYVPDMTPLMIAEVKERLRQNAILAAVTTGHGQG
jgi:capsular polysaccharide export protein